ncbi:MAG TPA: hypothetical protein VN957_21665 [Chthoniobacterales bacterium]|nr:hypothetical protein [Chthoniobacterales bacterium]
MRRPKWERDRFKPPMNAYASIKTVANSFNLVMLERWLRRTCSDEKSARDRVSRYQEIL